MSEWEVEMRSRFVALAAVVVVAGLAFGQEATQGWVRKLSEDGKSYVWTNEDSGGRGASLVFQCDGDPELEIKTRESLLDMADVEDGQIKVACLSPTDNRLVVEAFLSRSQHGVALGGDVVRYLRFEANLGQTVTILLSNNGKRETYTFANRTATPSLEALSCKMPKPPKR